MMSNGYEPELDPNIPAAERLHRTFDLTLERFSTPHISGAKIYRRVELIEAKDAELDELEIQDPFKSSQYPRDWPYTELTRFNNGDQYRVSDMPSRSALKRSQTEGGRIDDDKRKYFVNTYKIRDGKVLLLVDADYRNGEELTDSVIDDLVLRFARGRFRKRPTRMETFMTKAIIQFNQFPL